MAVRHPAAAGAFYPDSRKALEGRLDSLFSGVDGKQESLMAISPHAGYVYSGKTAAHATASLKPGRRFVILGPNHYLTGPPLSVTGSGSWETPLGKVMIDRKLASSLKGECGFLEEDAKAHEREHSIEVQLPFLQHRFGKVSFVPVCIMNTDYSRELLEACKSLGKGLASAAREGALIIASSDFSHYVSLEEAREKEREPLRMIMKLDPEGFFRSLDRAGASVCGHGPIACLLYAARDLGLEAELLHSSNSGDVTGDTSEIVSYHAIGFRKKAH